MKTKPLFLYGLGAIALAAGLAWPDSIHGQADGDPAGINGVLVELTAQQTLITENQTKIDEKIAAIGEDLRISRIFAARGGGKAK
ncbi:MAG: hypothetical protein JWL90_3210 [Chthoniobacteraceae bacterium]|nr:hypothetical protein [Chthoniobacteraceae bacterium]MDB6173933.1 hypothetical protein [Chthoniobacteraceae bacterium]